MYEPSTMVEAESYSLPLCTPGLLSSRILLSVGGVWITGAHAVPLTSPQACTTVSYIKSSLALCW